MNQFKKFAEDSFEKVEKGITSQVKTVAQSVKGQVAGQSTASDHDQGGEEQAQHAVNAQQQKDKATADMWEQILAPSEPQNASGKTDEPSKYQQELLDAGKTPEEIQQLVTLRKKLHDENYYIPLTQRKPREVEQKEEEQKKEEEKMKALQTEEEKKKKEQPIAVQMGANRTEQFPGASG